MKTRHLNLFVDFVFAVMEFSSYIETNVILIPRHTIVPFCKTPVTTPPGSECVKSKLLFRNVQIS